MIDRLFFPFGKIYKRQNTTRPQDDEAEEIDFQTRKRWNFHPAHDMELTDTETHRPITARLHHGTCACVRAYVCLCVCVCVCAVVVVWGWGEGSDNQKEKTTASPQTDDKLKKDHPKNHSDAEPQQLGGMDGWVAGGGRRGGREKGEAPAGQEKEEQDHDDETTSKS